MYSSNKNLILWSFPLVRDYDVRKQELLALSSDTRVLFIKGTKDWVSYFYHHSHNFRKKTRLFEADV